MSQDMDPFTEADTIIQVARDTEAATKAIVEAPPIINKTPELVDDTEKVNPLTSEVDVLKVSLQSERQAAKDLRKAFSKAEARNSEMVIGLDNVMRKVDQLCESVQRLEEKLFNSESEIQLLRTLELDISPTNRMMDTMLLQENHDLLVKCISQNLGYDGGKPVAACIIYKSLVHWRSFEVEGTNIFNRIIQTIASTIEVPDNNEVLAYWLSNLAMLLYQLQGMFTSATATHVHKEFKKQLIDFLEKVYGMMRDNLKIEILLLLGLCIEAPRLREKGQALISHWKHIVKSLTSYLNLMKANNVPPFLVSKVFTQIFSFINMKILNSFLLRRECCSLSNGKYVEAGLAELKQWCVEATNEYAASAWEELRHIRQAVGFLVIREKPKMTLEEITRELCPVLSIPQLYRISSMYWDGKYGTHSVSADFIANMRNMLTEDLSNRSFLFDDDLSIPFTVDDLLKSMGDVDVNDNEPPQLIRENPSFSFLLAPEKGSPS